MSVLDLSIFRLSFRARVYRQITRWMTQRRFLSRWVNRDRVEVGELDYERLLKWRKSSHRKFSESNRSGDDHRIWFHAASVGELETLWPVAMAVADRVPQVSVVLTVFSSSARGRIEKLADVLRSKDVDVLFCGYSPWEGRWGEALESVCPDAFLTAKYEAWPELWFSLSAQGIPLLIAGARARRSLRICRNILKCLGVKPPGTFLLSSLPGEVEALQRDLPEANVQFVGEPRWDQVMARAQVGNERAQKLAKWFADRPRPWGVMGSAWPADLAVWKSVWGSIRGTIWVVPHRVDDSHVGEMEEILRAAARALEGDANVLAKTFEGGADVVRTGAIRGPGDVLAAPKDRALQWVLVNEMGFLSELYSQADWAYVGGGFGDGVHSTIEPAIHGIPVVAGMARASRFAEIEELQSTGQLTLIRDAGELLSWARARLPEAEARRSEWVRQTHERLGATDRIFQILSSVLLSRRSP